MSVQHEVIVIAQQAIGQYLRVKALHALLQQAEQRRTVADVLKNWIAQASSAPSSGLTQEVL